MDSCETSEMECIFLPRSGSGTVGTVDERKKGIH